MKARIFYVLLFLILMVCLPISTSFGQTYEQERKQILEKQTNTRAEINVLNARINNYEKRIDLTEKKYDELYKQYADQTVRGFQLLHKPVTFITYIISKIFFLFVLNQ